MQKFLVFLLVSKGAEASSGGRLPEALFMVFQLDSKGAKDGFLSDSKGAKVCKSYPIFNFGSFLPKDACVNLVDLVKSFQTR